MKRYLILTLAAFALVLAAPSAFAVRVRVVDPTAVPCLSDTPCSIYSLGTTYQANFVSCAHPPIPSGINTDGYTFCLWLNNVTGPFASRLDFDMTVPAGAGGQQLLCDSNEPNVLVAIVCPTSLPADGASFGVTFLSNPPLTDQHDFYLLTDFMINPGSAGVTLSAASVPEPGELGLFGLGLLAIGMGYSWQRRRRTFRGNEAA